MSSRVNDQLIDHFFHLCTDGTIHCYFECFIREVPAACQRDGLGEYTQTRTTMRSQHLIVPASSSTRWCIFICIYVVCSTTKYNLMHLLSCFYQIHMVSFSVCRVGVFFLKKLSYFSLELSYHCFCVITLEKYNVFCIFDEIVRS
jgi:hypothetical protein